MRPFIVLQLLAAIAIAGDAPTPATPDVAPLLQRGDGQDTRHETRQAIASFEEADKLAPDHVEILLRLSKQYSDLAGTTREPAEAEKYARKGLQHAQRAAELEPKCAKAHLSTAICYGKLTDYVGNREKVELSKRIRDSAQRAVELDPTDDFAWHVMGRWHAGVANIGPALRAFCKVIYGGLPDASYEEAARYLKKASEIAPARIIHRVELAKAYTQLGKAPEARREWQAVLDLPALDKEDEHAKELARAALK